MFDISPMLNQPFRTFAIAKNASPLEQKVKKELMSWGNSEEDVDRLIKDYWRIVMRETVSESSSPKEIARALYEKS